MLEVIIVLIIIVAMIFSFWQQDYRNTRPVLFYWTDTSAWNTWQQILVRKQSNVKNLSYEDLYKYVKETNKQALVLFQIKNNKLNYVKSRNWIPKYDDSRFSFTHSLLKHTIQKYKINNVSFVASLSDHCYDVPFPVLSNLHHKNGTISFPHSWCHYFSGNKFPKFDPEIFDIEIQSLQSISTKSAQNKVLFRGNHRWPFTDKRLKLWWLSQFNKNLDVSFTKYMTPENMISQFRGVYSVRGIGLWTGATNRFLQSSSGVVFSVEEHAKDFVMLMLRPDVDYISIDNKLDNVFWKSNFIKDVEKMNNVSTSCKSKIKNIFSSNSLLLYTYHCIQSFSL